jgi:hypothetical protein
MFFKSHAALLLFFICLCSAFAASFGELRFYLDGSLKDEGVVTHDMLGSDFGPAEFNVTGRLIFLEPGLDCESTLPHSVYNGSIDYATLGDFILYWEVICK